jgi:carbonic anhydrase
MNDHEDNRPIVQCKPAGPLNLNAHFVGPNPVTTFNPVSISPSIDASAFIGPFSSVIGDVTIGPNVFVAPGVSIRADEGTPFHIGQGTNLQDGVILHGLREGRVSVGGKKYSIYIGSDVSCAHGCLIHGPCLLGCHVFVGFHAIVYNAIVCDGCYVSTNALVTGGVKVPPGRYVPTGAVIDTQAKADALGPVPQSQQDFAAEVIHVNHEFPSAYSLLFGSIRCSCGLACERETLLEE